nr:hypothetical protein CFP56_25030 [Quercus suber]
MLATFLRQERNGIQSVFTGKIDVIVMQLEFEARSGDLLLRPLVFVIHSVVVNAIPLNGGAPPKHSQRTYS